MPFIFFKNRIYALMDSCPFEGVRLTLLQAACARTAAQTIANLTSDTPGLSEKDRIEMSLERLSQRLGVRGGFLSEPEIRKYRYGNKLVSSSANIMKEFKDQLDQCLLYARAYNTEQQKKIYRMYLRVFQLFLANLGALISNLKPDFFYHV